MAAPLFWPPNSTPREGGRRDDRDRGGGRRRKEKREKKKTGYFLPAVGVKVGGVGGRLEIEIVRREVKHFQGVCNQPGIVAGARGSAGRLSAELRVGFVSTPANWNANGGLCDTTM